MEKVFKHTIDPKHILKILLAITFILGLLNLYAIYLRFFPERYSIYSNFHEFVVDLYVNQFVMNTEMNIPTYFATLQLLLASVLLFIIAAWKKLQGDRFHLHWKGLAFLLLLFSIDEFTAMHETLSKLLKELPDFYGLFAFKWVIAGIGFVLVFGALYFVFFLHLENKYKILFLSAAMLFFGGAIGFEVIGGRFANYNDTRNFIFHAITTIEEMLELVGISLLVYALLDYIKASFSEVRFLLEREQTKL